MWWPMLDGIILGWLTSVQRSKQKDLWSLFDSHCLSQDLVSGHILEPVSDPGNKGQVAASLGFPVGSILEQQQGKM